VILTSQFGRGRPQIKIMSSQFGKGGTHADQKSFMQDRHLLRLNIVSAATVCSSLRHENA
jgi:hypothetical protein